MSDANYLTVEKLSLQEIINLFARIHVNPDVAWNGTPCWQWTGAKNPQGYGFFWWQGQNYAHRVTYAWLVAPLPKRVISRATVDHLCRNHACVNPAHLEVVPTEVNTLRGIGLSAINAKKVVCKRGHKLSGDNLLLRRKGHRQERHCRTCLNTNRQIRRRERKQLGLPRY